MPIRIPASDLIETRHLKIQAEFALPSLTLVYSPEYLAKEKNDVARRLWPSIDDLDRAHPYNPRDVENVLALLRKSKSYHKAAIDGCLDLYGFAETISPVLEKLPGKPLPVEAIAQILANFVRLAKEEEQAAEDEKANANNNAIAKLATSNQSLAKAVSASKQIEKIMAAQSQYAFSSHYLSERYSIETQFTLFELVLALGVILIFVTSGFMGTDISYAIVFLAVLFGVWKIKELSDISPKYLRLSRIVRETEPVEVQVLCEMRRGTQIPEMKIVAGGPSLSWGIAWEISNQNFASDYKMFFDGAEHRLEIIFEPTGKPIAIFTGQRLYWLI